MRLLAAGELHRGHGPARSRRRRCATWSARARICAATSCVPATAGEAVAAPRGPLRRAAGSTGPKRIWGWLAGVRLQQPASQRALEDYRGAVAALMIRREQLEAEIARAAARIAVGADRRRLMCLRGIDTLTAAGLCAEIGDFARFRHPAQVMSYLGVVPSEHSSGERRRRGPITKSGSQHARRLLIEAAWHYRRPPRVGGQPRASPTRRRAGDPGAVMEGAAAAASRLAADGAAQQAPHDHRRRRRPRARRLLLGGRDRRLNTRRGTTLVERGGGTHGPFAQSIRETPMGSRRPVGDTRCLDGGL